MHQLLHVSSQPIQRYAATTRGNPPLSLCPTTSKRTGDSAAYVCTYLVKGGVYHCVASLCQDAHEPVKGGVALGAQQIDCSVASSAQQEQQGGQGAAVDGAEGRCDGPDDGGGERG